MNAIIIIIILVFIGVIIGIISNSNSKSQEDPIVAQERIVNNIIEENKQEIVNFIKPYVKQLAIKEEQLIYKDDYGDYILDDWFSEQNRFIEKKMTLILIDLNSKANKIFDNTISLDNYKKSYRNDIRKYIETDIIHSIGLIIDALISDYHDQTLKDDYSFIYNTDDPILFEKSVAKNFELYGWNANETKKTGDQGADVIAENNGMKIIVQCKLYSRPIGNKAVQEVVAAKNYYKGNMALVVSNANYTKSAQKLAESNEVILLHYSDLDNFLENIQNS